MCRNTPKTFFTDGPNAVEDGFHKTALVFNAFCQYHVHQYFSFFERDAGMPEPVAGALEVHGNRTADGFKFVGHDAGSAVHNAFQHAVRNRILPLFWGQRIRFPFVFWDDGCNNLFW